MKHLLYAGGVLSSYYLLTHLIHTKTLLKFIIKTILKMRKLRYTERIHNLLKVIS